MKKKYKVVLRIIIIAILLLVVVYGLVKFLGPKEENGPKVVDAIKSYDYTLDDRDSELMKETYNELKSILNDKNINMEEYAKTIAKLFVIDLFTIENKHNKYDVGGTEYVYPDSRENFKLKVEDTLYKTVKTNTDGKRKQNLPAVKSVNVENCEKSEYTIGESDKYTSFIIDLSWEYESDLGYDKKAQVTCIEKENKVYIVEYKTGE